MKIFYHSSQGNKNTETTEINKGFSPCLSCVLWLHLLYAASRKNIGVSNGTGYTGSGIY